MLLLTGLFTAFGFYNYSIYSGASTTPSVTLSAKAQQGQALWQQNNCFSCHQLYGLGGYLGPDLTNTYSAKGKGGEYIKALINSGIKSMPKFDFNEEEKDALATFLKEVDATGYYPNYNSSIQTNGWVEIELKDEK